MDEADVFSDYLSRRLEHHKTRLEKVGKYLVMEPAQLNQDQKNAISQVEKSEGKREEANFLMEKYESQREKRKETLDKLLAEAREQGRAEARAELQSTLELVSSFLHSMSEQFKMGRTEGMQSSREAYAFYQLLAQFYAGGQQGATAMQQFVTGDSSVVCDNGILFSDLKQRFESPDWKMETPPVPMQGPAGEDSAASSSAGNGEAVADKVSDSTKPGQPTQPKPRPNGKSVWAKGAHEAPWKQRNARGDVKADAKLEKTESKVDLKPDSKLKAKPGVKPEAVEPRPGLKADKKEARPENADARLDVRSHTPEPARESARESDVAPTEAGFGEARSSELKLKTEPRKPPSRKGSPENVGSTTTDDFQVAGKRNRKRFTKTPRSRTGSMRSEFTA